MTGEGMNYSIRYWLEVQFPREVVMVIVGEAKSTRVVWDVMSLNDRRSCLAMVIFNVVLHIISINKCFVTNVAWKKGNICAV